MSGYLGADTIEKTLTAIKKCQSKSELDKVLHQRTQMVACHVVPRASSKHQLDILGKLFVFESNPALQLAAGHALQALLFRQLDRGEQKLPEFQELERIMRQGLTIDSSAIKDSTLLGVFVKLYKLTIFALVLASKQSSVSDKKQLHVTIEASCILSDLKSFKSNCHTYHPSLTKHVDFQLKLTMAALQHKIWLDKTKDKTKDGMGKILQLVNIYINTTQAPEDKKKGEETILKTFADKKMSDTERCVLLHYLASVVHNCPKLLQMCIRIFHAELIRSQGKLFGLAKSRNLLVSCAVLFQQICLSITDEGRYFWSLQ